MHDGWVARWVLGFALAAAPARAGAQGVAGPESAPASRPWELDARELGRAWQPSGSVLVGPISRGSALPPPLRPGSWLVVDAVGTPREAMRAFVERFLLDEGAPPPREGDPFVQGTAWRSIAAPERGEVTGSFQFAYVRVRAAAPEVRFARLPGARALFVNGEGFFGDPDRRGYRGVPIALQAGDNHLYVAGIRGGFDLELWKPDSRMLIARWDVQYPRTAEEVAKPSVWDSLVVPVFNASEEPAERVCFHYGHVKPDDGTLPAPLEWACGWSLRPLAMLGPTAYLNFGVDKDKSWFPGDADMLLPLAVYQSGDADADRAIVRIRPPSIPTKPRDRVPGAWPIATQDAMTEARNLDFRTANLCIVLARVPTDREHAATLAVGRFLQQELWYFADVIPALLTEDEFERRAKGTSFQSIRIVLAGKDSSQPASRGVEERDTLRCTVGAPPTSLPTDPVDSMFRRHRRESVIEATSLRALRLLYAVDLLDPSLLSADVAEWRATRGPDAAITRVR